MRLTTRAMFLAGAALGYVAGTRAGRERFEQLRRGARTLRENSTVQEAAGIAGAQAYTGLNLVRARLADRLQGSALGDKLADRLRPDPEQR